MEYSNYGKANRRIERWAKNENQINHKIVYAYFICIENEGFATIEYMRKLCSNKNDKTLYVEKFNENYANMKTDAAHSHGKVFEDDKNKVWIWSVVEPTLLKYKSEFMKVKKG